MPVFKWQMSGLARSCHGVCDADLPMFSLLKKPKDTISDILPGGQGAGLSSEAAKAVKDMAVRLSNSPLTSTASELCARFPHGQQPDIQRPACQEGPLEIAMQHSQTLRAL